MREWTSDVAIVGTGIVGIATAYYLGRRHGMRDLVLLDAGQPMAFTSAQSGENYRNWWPHPAMVALTNRSIDLLEDVARESGNRIRLTRRGYALATRASDIDAHLAELRAGLRDAADADVRIHERASASGYRRCADAGWASAPAGVDVLRGRRCVHAHFPSLAADVENVIHVRRAGDFDSQQLAVLMLEGLRAHGVRRRTASVEAIDAGDGFRLALRDEHGRAMLRASRVVNAAGPFLGEVAQMLGVSLDVHNVFQQKLAFEDVRGAIPRDLPFTIDLDAQTLAWPDDARDALAEDPGYAWLTQEMPGAVHCRPEGRGRWVKLGWAFNTTPQAASRELPLMDAFPEIVLRGAARMHAALEPYCDDLPRSRRHYGGWYTMTDENWPLVGPLGVDGAFVNGAMSGFGTMAACAAGELCAAWVAGAPLPEHAAAFSMQRHANAALMQTLRAANRGIL